MGIFGKEHTMPFEGTYYTRANFSTNLRFVYHSVQFIREELKAISNGSTSNTKFNGRNSWGSWGLIPASRPVVNPPQVKTNYIDIPGGHGSIDVSEALTDYPVYGDRTGSFEFYVVGNDMKNDLWYQTYNMINEYCHGRRMRVILLDDPEIVYVGRVAVNNWKSEKDWSKIVIDYRLNPFQYDQSGRIVGNLVATVGKHDTYSAVVSGPDGPLKEELKHIYDPENEEFDDRYNPDIAGSASGGYYNGQVLSDGSVLLLGDDDTTLIELAEGDRF